MEERARSRPSLAVVAVLAFAASTSSLSVCDAHHWRSMSCESAIQKLSAEDPDAAGLAARRLTALSLDTIRHLRRESGRDDERGELARLLLSKIKEAVR